MPEEPSLMPAPASPQSPRHSLTADAWAEAALDAIAANGIEAVAVEPLARRLGVTKGSFYWHFSNREALLRAAIEHWERLQTAAIAAADAAGGEPRDRLLTLFRRLANTDARSERLLLMLSNSDHPLAREAERRVSARWRTYCHSCYRALGCDESEAVFRSTFAYSTFIGTIHLRRDEPEALPDEQNFGNYLRFLIRSLVPPGCGSEGSDWPPGELPHPAAISSTD